jgi:hypothetical protein
MVPPDDADHPWTAELSVNDRLALGLSGTGVRQLSAVVGLSPARLDEEDRLDLLIVLDRARAWVDALQQQVLAEIDRADGSDRRWSAERVMLALSETAGVARRRLRAARTLVDDLPGARALLSAGQLTVGQAGLMTMVACTVTPDAMAAFEQLAIGKPGRMAPAGLRQSLTRAAARVDPVTAELRHRRAAAERCVGTAPQPDGMAELRIIAPAPDIQTAWRRIDAAARLLPADDARSMDQKRTDLFLDGLLSGLRLEALPEAQGRAPTIEVLVSLSTLLGLDDAPAELAGNGAITAEQPRRLASDTTGTWRRLVLDPQRQRLLDRGTRVYRPPQPLADHVICRDRCRRTRTRPSPRTTPPMPRSRPA